VKNILIIGIGRAGKTTLSNMIKRKYKNYNLIHSDSIKWGIIRGEGKEDFYRSNVEKQKEWECNETFQNTLLEFFNSCIKNDGGEDGYLVDYAKRSSSLSAANGFGYILESGQLELKNVIKRVSTDGTIIVCLGLGNLSKQGIFDLCRMHDTKKDWSYETSDEDLRKHIDKWYETNQILKEDCLKYGFDYIDTTKNRKEVLDQVLENISKEIESQI